MPNSLSRTRRPQGWGKGEGRLDSISSSRGAGEIILTLSRAEARVPRGLGCGGLLNPRLRTCLKARPRIFFEHCGERSAIWMETRLVSPRVLFLVEPFEFKMLELPGRRCWATCGLSFATGRARGFGFLGDEHFRATSLVPGEQIGQSLSHSLRRRSWASAVRSLLWARAWLAFDPSAGRV